MSEIKIHHTALISDKARIGKDVEIGPYTIINDDVVIEENTVIGSYCEIGHPSDLASTKTLLIGKNSCIRSHSIIYEGSIFGEGLETGHRVTLRENIKTGLNFKVGTLGDIQGDCEIGDYVRAHSNVHIGKLSKIGNYVWIFPYVVLTNDPHPPSNDLIGVLIEDYAVVATMSVILPGVRIGKHSLVGAHSLVKSDVLPFEVVVGSPAKKICNTSAIKLNDMKTSAYPWTTHFHRGYPDDVIEKWKSINLEENL